MATNSQEKLLERTETYLYDFLNSYRRYHNHKERNGYVAFIVYLGFFASALLAGEWPLHHEHIIPDCITIFCVSVIWIYALIFMKWQLRNRRIAAIYVAAAQETLAQLLSDTIPPNKLKPSNTISSESKDKTKNNIYKINRWVYLFLDHIWPINVHRFISVDVDPIQYPLCLAESIKRRYNKGTGAIVHERLLVFLGWLIYVGIIIRILTFSE